MSPRVEVVFAGGGTAGHITPGLAVAEQLRRIEPAWRPLFVGTARPFEAELIAKAGFEHRALPVVSLSQWKSAPLRLMTGNWRAMAMAREILTTLRPRVVVGLGGYASAPLVWAAWRRGIPVVLLEQNAVLGRANRWLARLATMVCLSFEESRGGVPRGPRVLVTGNPVRGDIARLWTPHISESVSECASPRLLVLGGSLGAAPINAAVVALCRLQGSDLAGWRVVHQTGQSDYASTVAAYRALEGARLESGSNASLSTVSSRDGGAAVPVRLVVPVGSGGGEVRVEVHPFLKEMPTRYREASLIICRAGASTLAEVACARRPAVVIPFPQSAHDHQRKNAAAFARHGGVKIVEQQPNAEATACALASALASLLTSATERNHLAVQCAALAHPNAAAVVAQTILELTVRTQ